MKWSKRLFSFLILNFEKPIIIFKDGVTIAWKPPAVARGRVDYEVEMRTNGSSARIHETEENYFNAVNLRANTDYEFRVYI